MHKQLKRVTDYEKNLPIVEIYTAVQSEGSRAGYPTVVIRTTGCTHRCYFGEGGWCDSWYTSIDLMVIGEPETTNDNNIFRYNLIYTTPGHTHVYTHDLYTFTHAEDAEK